MRVQLDSGQVIELGETEATPTISLTDFSLRETDDFGVTTVVPREFARRMAVKLIVPFDQVDTLQRTLASLRAKPALWVADERYASLAFRGFYKDFQIDLAGVPVSYCTLTVEGLVASEAFNDDGSDPAPLDYNSTLQLLQPAIIEGPALIASSVKEADYPEWDGGASYPKGARVIKAATHRTYESAIDGNAGNDPAGASGKWFDIGPTNRWAMFDQALGTATTGAGAIAVEVQSGVVGGIALLDIVATSVRVQIGGYYDQTKQPTPSGTVTFLDIPNATDSAVVTISGPGTVSVGTLLIGRLVDLGLTETSPTAGITDFSLKETDQFGAVTVVERAWAKRMSLRSVIRTDAIDIVAGRIAAVRAQPSLWIGSDGIDSLTIYGFFKDFAIEVDANISKLSLAIEGLSTADKDEPLRASIDWPDVGDPDGTKPQDNADVTSENTSKDTNAVAGKDADELIDEFDAAKISIGKALALIGTIPEGSTVAEEIAAIEVVDYGGNLLSSSDFASGTAGWHLYENPAGKHTWGVDPADFVLAGDHYLGLLGLEPNGDHDGVLYSDWIAVEPGDWVQASAWLAARECVNRILIDWGDAAGNMLQAGAAASDAVGAPFTGTNDITSFDRVWCKAQAPSGARTVRMAMDKGPYLANPGGYLSWGFLLRPMLSLGSASMTVPTNYKPAGGGAGLNLARARIEEVSTAAALDTAAVALRSTNLEAAVGGPGGLMARTSTVEGVAADAKARTAAALYQQTVSVDGGRAQMTMYALNEDGTVRSGIDFVGDNFTFLGDVIIRGSFKPDRIDASLFAREGTMSWSGFVSPNPGETVNVPASLTLNPLQPQGRFFYEVYIGFSSNAGQQTVGNYNGKPYYINYQDDGGMFLRSYDDQGNVYRPVHGTSEGVRATTVFGTTFVTSVSRGNYDSGIVNEGDYYSRTLSATYTLSSLNLHITWIAV